MRIDELKQGDFFRFTAEETRVTRHLVHHELMDHTFEVVYRWPYVLCRYLQWSGCNRYHFQIYDVLLEYAYIEDSDDVEVIKDMPCKCCYDCILHNPYISIIGCCSL